MFGILILALFAADAEPRPGPWPMRGYSCPRTAGEIVMDGIPDEPGWADAAWTDPFVDIEGDRQPQPTFATTAKMCWDDEYFHVAARLEEPHLWGTLRERDSVIYYDNDFEVFLDPDGDSHLYTEIELNALNTVWDLLLVKPYRNGGPAIHAWDIPGLETAVHLEGTLNDPSDVDRGWTVEIAIPFAVISETTNAKCPPESGDRWRVNFSRVQWDLEESDGGYRKIDGPEHNWVWSPQRMIAMHEPEHWGIVEFVDETAAAPEPGAEQAAEWHLRYASYQLAQAREETGTWPATFSYAAPEDGPEQSGPVAYWSDGERYTLRLTVGALSCSLTEDGRLTVRGD
jgi:hypothetical protein